MTLDPAVYWKLRNAVATAGGKHLEAQLHQAQAALANVEAVSLLREGLAAIGVEATPTMRLEFDDATFTFTVRGEPDATPT